MRVVSFTTVFPNMARPLHGLFILERLRPCTSAEIRVVAPWPFLPWSPWIVPRRTERLGLPVLHPTFRYLPRFGKYLDGLFLYASVLPTMRRLRREYPFDVIDAHFAYPDGFAAVLLGRTFRVPVVITVHGNEPLVTALGAWRRRAVAFALGNASRVVAVSEPLAAFVHTTLAGRQGPIPSVRVVANGVDCARFAPAPQAEARRLLGLPLRRQLIVSVGHLSTRKGFHRVLRALPGLLAEAPNAMFAVVGGPGAEGNNGAELRRLAAVLGLADRVVFAGPQPPERVATWLNAADLFVLASDHEGCPCVVLEALACGLPVVATRVGGVEHLVPGFAGHLFDDPEDTAALRGALAAGLRGGHDRTAIRAWAERHNWAALAADLEAEWVAAVASSAAGARAAL